MHKSITALTLAGAVAVGGLTGSVLSAPLAGAVETAGGAVSWVEEAISGLVDDGTITQDQADAVASALDEARPERGAGGPGMGGHGWGRHVDLATVAATLELTEEEVRSALADGRTVAELAAEQGVEVDAVVVAIVEAHQERLEEAVAAGELSQEEADELVAAAEERAQAFVDGAVPAFRGGGHRGGFPVGGPAVRPGAGAEEGAATDDGTAEGTSAAA